VLEALKGAGGRLSFCDATPTIEKTLQNMGLLQESTMDDGEDEAVVALGG
jgi:anti-anti-sigma regulatory factor